LIITIDGPASSGKGTIAKKLATKLGYVYLDTGAMYRALTYYCLEHHIDVFNEELVCRTLDALDISFDTAFAVYVNGEDVSKFIRTDKISSLSSSPVSTYACVRAGIVEKERAIARAVDDIIVDGRDSGSVVFPAAECKFFISASLNERAKRRDLQNVGLGAATDIMRIRTELAKRDRDDMTRPIAPLVIPIGAIVVDTTRLSVDETVAYVYQKLQNQFA